MRDRSRSSAMIRSDRRDAHAGFKFGRIKRLGDVVSCAQLQSAELLFGRCRRGQEDHRHVLGSGVRLEREQTSNPSISGISTSRRIRSGVVFRASSSPLVPLSAR